MVNSISLKEGEAGLHRSCPHRAPLRRRGGGDGVRRKRAGRHARTQDRDLQARLRHIWSIRSVSRPRTSSSIRTSSPSRPAWRSTTATASLSSRRRAGSARICRTRMCQAACRICRFRSAATSACARRCTRCFCFTPSRPAWIWASSMPARWRSMTISIRNCAKPARTWCSIAGPMRPSGCWTWRKKFQGAGQEAKEVDLAWREQPVEKRLSHALVHGITDFIETDVEEARTEREAPARRDRRPADGRHEHRRRPVRLGQDVPAAGGEVGARDEAGGRLPDALHGAGEGRPAAARRARTARS